MPSQQDEKRQAAREVIDILYEISTLLVSSLIQTSSVFISEVNSRKAVGGM